MVEGGRALRRGQGGVVTPSLLLMNGGLKVEGLACARGGLRVLEGVSFKVAPGAALVLRGANGSGKTTLLRTLAGLQPAEAGQSFGAGEAAAYAGHGDGVKGTLSVAENLQFWADIFGAGSIEPALEAFELRDLAGRPAQSLSAGQKRRLGLARMLVIGRSVWLLDEPTVSLDRHAVALFRGVVERHLATGGLAVIATHIELGIEAKELDVTVFRAAVSTGGAFDEAFL